MLALWLLLTLLDRDEPEVGGPIQLVRVDRHGEVTPIAIARADGPISVLGRELVGYENVSVPIARVDEMARPNALVPIDWPQRFVPRDLRDAGESVDEEAEIEIERD